MINDFPSFVDAQAKVDETYADKAKWCKLSIQAGVRSPSRLVLKLPRRF